MRIQATVGNCKVLSAQYKPRLYSKYVSIMSGNIGTPFRTEALPLKRPASFSKLLIIRTRKTTKLSCWLYRKSIESRSHMKLATHLSRVTSAHRWLSILWQSTDCSVTNHQGCLERHYYFSKITSPISFKLRELTAESLLILLEAVRHPCHTSLQVHVPRFDCSLALR